MKKILLLILMVVGIFFVGHADQISTIIAKVNNEVITSKDLEIYCESLAFRTKEDMSNVPCEDEAFKGEALLRLIDDKLVLDKAKEEKMIIPDFVIEKRFGEILSSYSSRKEFESSLYVKGLTITSLKEKIGEQLLMREVINKYVRSSIGVGPREISRYYEENRETFESPPKYLFYMAKSEDSNMLRDISRLIKKRGLAEAQRVYGNMLNEIEADRKELKKEVADILTVLVKGECGIEKIEDTFYLIYLEDIEEGYSYPFEDVREKIRAFLWEERFQKRFNEWIGELRKQAVIKVL
jgi:peptidyl-prolyl cis-trans isomerase SurA